MKIHIPSTLQSAKTFDDVRRFLAEFAQNVENMFSKKLTFSEHIQSTLVENVLLKTTGLQKITHNLGVIPKGFIVLKNDNTSFITAAGTWTNNEIYVTSSVQCFANILVIAR